MSRMNVDNVVLQSHWWRHSKQWGWIISSGDTTSRESPGGDRPGEALTTILRKEKIFLFHSDLPGKRTRSLTRKQSKVQNSCLIIEARWICQQDWDFLKQLLDTCKIKNIVNFKNESERKISFNFYSCSPSHYTLRQLWDKVRKSLGSLVFLFLITGTTFMPVLFLWRNFPLYPDFPIYKFNV